MFKGRLIVETIGGEAIDREIEIAEGEGLIFLVKDAKISKKAIDEIRKFMSGEKKCMILSGGDIEIIKLKTAKKTTPSVMIPGRAGDELEDAVEKKEGKTDDE